MNNNDSLKEKAIRANELENVSGGWDGEGFTYQIKNCNSSCTKGYPPCASICPCEAMYCTVTWRFYDSTYHYHIEPIKCNACGKCVSECPYGLIQKVQDEDFDNYN